MISLLFELYGLIFAQLVLNATFDLVSEEVKTDDLAL